MKTLSEYPRSLYGFRFSLLDAMMLIVSAVIAIWLAANAVPVWWMIPLVVGHFFLFCNVFRVRRRYELIWAVVLLFSSACWILHVDFAWLAPTLTQLPFTAAVIVHELRSAHYHGILSEKVNPRLAAYLESRLEQPQRGETTKPGASDSVAQPQVTAGNNTQP